LTRAYCLTCNEQVDVDDDGRCPRGHVVSAEDLGPQPWIGRALSAVGEPPARLQASEPGPSAPEPTADEPDELAALLADLDDGGPADLMTEDEPSDSASELAALAEELALRADSTTGDDDVVSGDDEGDDTLGALDDAMSAWDESDEAIVAPSETVPDDAVEEGIATEAIPPPPPPDAEPPATAPPPPPLEDLFAEADGDDEDDEDAWSEAAPTIAEEPPAQEPPTAEPPTEEPRADDLEAAPREIDLTNFTASGKRVDTSSAPRKKGGRFGFGR
jgi:hypothetical protein